MQFKRDRSPGHSEYHRTFKQQARSNDHVCGGLSTFGDGQIPTGSSAESHPFDCDVDERGTGRSCECHVTGCNQSFASSADFEEHYRTCHSFVCRYCQRFYATSHLLEIHLLETHDSLFSLMSQQRPMYQCLEPACKECFMDSRTRDEHAIHCHGYPTHFKFDRRQRGRVVDLTGGREENRDVSARGQRRNTDSCQPTQPGVPDVISFGIGGSELFRVPESNGRGRTLPVLSNIEDPMDAT